MDFQKFVDGIKSMTCVISVEKSGNTYGKIRIVAVNQAFVDSVENLDRFLTVTGVEKFIPNSEYQKYFPKDANFEDSCYRCAILKQPIHNYVHPVKYDFWFHLFMLPIASDDENIGYCTYTREISRETSTSKMTQTSYETASAVLNTCIKLRGAVDFEKTIQEVMDDIRKICNARHCCLLQVDFSDRKCKVLADAYSGAEARRPMKHWEDQEHFELVNSWSDLIGESNSLIAMNKQDMERIREANPNWHASLRKASVESIALFPLKARGELLGYIWATNFEVNGKSNIKETLELTTFFLASEISGYQMFDRLRILSTMDMLTGVYNRNEMNNRVDRLSGGAEGSGKPIGVVFADLNGLKRVNDTEGHLAGDLLLKNAAMILKSVFVENEIYRAGGDEFMVLIEDATPQLLEWQAERIKNQAGVYKDVSFSVGYCYETDGRNVRRALKIADQRMYADKERYYALYPELRRGIL